MSHRFSYLPLVLALLWALAVPTAAAQSDAPACARTAPAVPSLGSLTSAESADARRLHTRPVPLADAFRGGPSGRDRYTASAPAPQRPCSPSAAARGDEPLLEQGLFQEYVGGDWANLGRGLYSYNEVDSLAAFESQYWAEGEWQFDWRETWEYDAEGRVVEHAFRAIFFGVEDGWRELFTFDDVTGLLTESYYQVYDGSAWVDSGWTTYAYTAEGLLETVTVHTLEGADWVPLFENTFTYDDQGRTLTNNARVYDPIAQAWTPTVRSTWTYDEGGYTQLGERWTGDAWENEFVDTYTLNEGGYPTFFLGQMWEDGAWVNVLRESIAYLTPTSPLRTETEVRWWGGSGEGGGPEEWVDGWREFFTYDDDQRMTEYTYLTGVGADTWENAFRLSYAYSDGLLMEEVEEVGDGAGGWVNQYQAMHFYDFELGVLTERLESQWEGGEWAIRWRTLYTYRTGTDAGGEAPQAALGLAVYPNPAAEATIAVTLDRAAPVEVEVVDVLGRRVARLLSGEVAAGSRHLRWRPEGLAPGLYFVRLRAGEHTAVKPFTLVR